MRLNAIIKAGLISGLALGLTLHWLIFARLYPRVYQFEWPAAVNALTAPVGIAFLIALISIGPLAVIFTQDVTQTSRQGLVTGAAAGIIASVVVYLAVGVLANTLGLGVVPLIMPLADPAPMTNAGLHEVLSRVTGDAIPATYAILVASLSVGALVGGVEGWSYVLVQTWARHRRAKQSEQKAL